MMMGKFVTADSEVSGAASTTPTKAIRTLLACGVAAGPLFIVVALVQMVARDGFDPARYPLSLLSNGDLG
jgi:hypothetical protein